MRPSNTEVAEMYTLALSQGRPPRNAVAFRWSVSRACASLWIRQARTSGALTVDPDDVQESLRKAKGECPHCGASPSRQKRRVLR